IPVAVNRDAFAAAVCKRLQITEAAVGIDGGAIGDVFALVADVPARTALGRQEAQGAQVVGPPPTGIVAARIDFIGRLRPRPDRRQDQTAVRRDVNGGSWLGDFLRE